MRFPILLLILALSAPPASAAGKFRRLAEHLWSGCAAVFGSVFSNSKLDVDALENDARQVNPVLAMAPFSAEERAELQKLYGHTRDEIPVMALLADFGGDRTQLLHRLRYESARLAEIQNGTVPIDRWLAIAGWEDVAALWTQHAPKWKAEATTKSLRSPTAGAQVDSGPKPRLRFRVAPNEEPLPMVAAEEVLHLETLDLVEKNQGLIDAWVRRRVGSVRFRAGLEKKPLIERDGAFQFGYDMALRTIRDPEVRHVLEFLMERDAMFKKLELYRKLVATRPELRTKQWDAFAAASNPKLAMTEALNETFQIPPDILRELRNFTVDDVIRITGGKTRDILDHEARFPGTATADREVPLPSLLQAPPTYGSALTGTVSEMKDAARDQLIAHLQKAKAPNPHAILILQVYDEVHGTNFALTEGMRLIRQMPRDANTLDNQTMIGQIVLAVEASKNPRAVADLYGALAESPSMFQYLSGPNQLAQLSALLARRGNTPPDAAMVERLYLHAVAYHRGIGQSVADVPGNAPRLQTALDAARAAEKYFRGQHDERRSEVFAAEAQKTADLIELLRR